MMTGLSVATACSGTPVATTPVASHDDQSAELLNQRYLRHYTQSDRG
jgi:hypothetical protein